MNGVITKGIGGFYYVQTDKGLIECRARGKFRKMNLSPQVGDNVEIELSENEELKGSIENIMPRKNIFVRPPVANIDSIIATFAVENPEPNLLLLDKLTTAAVSMNVDCIICINKIDLNPQKAQEYKEVYEKAGFKVILTSSTENIGTNILKDELKGKVSALAGNSGVGKSSLINTIDPNLNLKTGDLSKKIQRGRHTTRHCELFPLSFGGFILDTPGFSSFDISLITQENPSSLFPEISKYSSDCRFAGCKHIAEPDCAVKEALRRGDIAFCRYESYKALSQEIDNLKPEY
ncbi:MAG: ribosome small subunit-dependent GTPase A [Ruminococcaceae bacterium]|nr:ribosome small subunit-dependent GTPase A [Oscillospiraceae bacterium]